MNRFRRRAVSEPVTAQAAPANKKRFCVSAGTKRSLIMLAVLAAIAAIAFVSAPFWINWLWYKDLGYQSVLMKTYLAQGLAFFLAALLAALLFLSNLRLALRNSTKYDVGEDNKFGRLSNTALRWLIWIGTLVVAFLAGRFVEQRWQDAVLFFNGRKFDVKDPTFGRDVGFYVFQLPFFRTLETLLVALLIVTTLAVLLVYLIRMGLRFKSWGTMPKVALRHLSALISALLLVMALHYLFSNFDLVYSTRGVVTGPGFTDSNIVRPLNWIMIAMSVIAAILILTGYVMRSPKLFLGVLGIWALAAFVLLPTLPMLVQRIGVEPNEFHREKGYISHNMDMTRSAFALNEVTTVDLTGQEVLDPTSLSTEPGGELANVRIWDYRVVGPIYKQIQTFVPFYEFPDIDVDRYMIDGQHVQVIVGVRELNLDGLAPGKQTWTNKHLVYTHGYGYVMSPVSEVNPDGWPSMLVSGVPMMGPPELTVENPQIYFGETDLQWVILFSKQPEISGLQELGDRGEGFQGKIYGSVGLGNPVTRIMAALTLEDRNVFFSGQLTGKSRLVLHRNILDRVEKIAPFLTYEQDPYLVVDGGRTYWVIDAYTQSDKYPHATRYNGRNYLRNSVKVVVDAYSGETTFYRTDVDDPIADAWGSVYPELFTPYEEISPSLAAHFRYPETLFEAQTDAMADYHMSDPRVWYDGDDRWVRSREASDEANRYMEPYFVHQTLPGDDAADFWLTIPFTPGGNRTNENMTAWFAGRSTGPGTTELRLYRYPRQVTVYGPRQVEAIIDQNPDISAQITLWSQGGSNVIRGNMLVIPVGDALLYVQPLYLQAKGTSAGAPTLARVIVAANNEVVMRPTLKEAIDALSDPNPESVGDITATPDQNTQPEVVATPAVDRTNLPPELASLSEQELANEAMATMDRADKAMRDGDPVTYQTQMERLRIILEALSGGQPAVIPTLTPSN